jgi:acetyltransferase-like isoleucine patch superfamily enzyme
MSCRLRGLQFQAGSNLRIFGRLSIRGPGSVRLGNDVVIDMTVTPWTYSPEARIEIGDRVFLNGTRFGCAEYISIGPDSMIGEASVLDTNFHSTSRERHHPEAPVRTAPIRIGANVWVAAQAGLLPGTTIGNHAVVGFGAVCSGSYPGNTVIAAPRAGVIRSID